MLAIAYRLATTAPVMALHLAGRISEHAAKVLQTVVHQRYKLRRAIVVTSNRVV